MIHTNIEHLNDYNFSGALEKAVNYLKKNHGTMFTQEVGKYEVDSDIFYMIQEYEGKEENKWEAHQKYIDIQIVISGEEEIDLALKKDVKQLGDYNPEKDFIGFEGDATIKCIFKANDLGIYFPNDVHKPGLKTSNYDGLIRKCIMKIKV